VVKSRIGGKPSIHADPFWRGQNRVVINPVCMVAADAAVVGKALRHALGRVSWAATQSLFQCSPWGG
jgi:hypothetical protein